MPPRVVPVIVALPVPVPMVPSPVVRRMPPRTTIPILAVDRWPILPAIVLVPVAGIGLIMNNVGAVILNPFLGNAG